MQTRPWNSKTVYLPLLCSSSLGSLNQSSLLGRAQLRPVISWIRAKRIKRRFLLLLVTLRSVESVSRTRTIVKEEKNDRSAYASPENRNVNRNRSFDDNSLGWLIDSVTITRATANGARRFIYRTPFSLPVHELFTTTRRKHPFQTSNQLPCAPYWLETTKLLLSPRNQPYLQFISNSRPIVFKSVHSIQRSCWFIKLNIYPDNVPFYISC